MLYFTTAGHLLQYLMEFTVHIFPENKRVRVMMQNCSSIHFNRTHPGQPFFLTFTQIDAQLNQLYPVHEPRGLHLAVVHRQL